MNPTPSQPGPEPAAVPLAPGVHWLGEVVGDQPPAPRPGLLRRWRWPLIAAAAVLVFGATAAATYAMTSGSSDTLDVHGSLTLNDPDAGFGVFADTCEGSGGYSDIHAGAQVTVTGPDGTALAIGQLGTGTAAGALGSGIQPDSYAGCRFRFEVANVPAGHDLYGIEIAGRGVITFTEEELQSVTNGPALTLG